jgi:hypothetical protein
MYGGTIKVPNFMRLGDAKEPFTAESLLRIADEIAQPLHRTIPGSAGASQRPATAFTELLQQHNLVQPAAAEELAAEERARVSSADMRANVRPAPLTQELPMRRKLYDPKHIGEELRRFHAVTKGVLDAQEDEVLKTKAATTGARRKGGRDRLKAGFDRKEDSVTVSSFLSPLLQSEKSRQKSRMQAEAARKKQAAVYKVQAMEGASLMSRREHYEQHLDTAQRKERDHMMLVANATLVQKGRDADELAGKRDKKESRRARLDAIRAERTERQGTFSRYNAMSSTRRAEERKEVQLQRQGEMEESHEKRKAETAAARQEFLGWLELLRENKTLDRLAKRAEVWERAAAMKDLHREAQRIKVAKARGERFQLKPLDKGGGNRNRMSYHGLRGNPANKTVANLPMAGQLVEEPAAGMYRINVSDLSARAYPKQFWSGLPRALKHQALVEEFEERWQAIGSFCGKEMCKLSPRNACDACFNKFRIFADRRIESNGQAAHTAPVPIPTSPASTYRM